MSWNVITSITIYAYSYYALNQVINLSLPYLTYPP